MLNNEVALVTGVSSGIGRETALLLAQRGARVFGSVRRDSLEGSLPGVDLVHVDVTDEESVQEAVRVILQKAGGIQILVNKAGNAVAGARQQFETNFFGVMRLTQPPVWVMELNRRDA
jgi:NAD(P)-dependent dehydrogenase (short-subunit alcohol dehydrogenase family)